MRHVMLPVLLEGLALLCSLCCHAHGEALDVGILTGTTYAAAPEDKLDCGILCPVMTSAPAESLDLSILGCEPAPKPTGTATMSVKNPQPLLDNLDGKNFTKRQVNFNANPTRAEIVSHLLGGNNGAHHAGKFTASQLAPLTDVQLLQLHDRDHDTIEKQPTVSVPAPVTYYTQPSTYCVNGRCYTTVRTVRRR